MQFNLILLIGCRVGKRNTGQQAELAGTLNSVCCQYPLVTSPQMLKRWLTLYVHGINLFLLDNPTPQTPLEFLH